MFIAKIGSWMYALARSCPWLGHHQGTTPHTPPPPQSPQPCDLELWLMTLKNNKALLLCCFKLCVSFRSHQSIQSGVTWLQSGKTQYTKSPIFGPVWLWNLMDDPEHGKSEGFDSCDRPCNLTQIGFKSSIFQPVWPRKATRHRTDGQTDKTDRQTENTIHRAAWSQLKTIGHLFYTTLSYGHYSKAIGEFKLELQSGNAQFVSKSAIFFVPCDLDNWRMALKNDRAPLLCCFKLCASFESHQYIKTGVTVRKRQIWVKIDDIFLAVWPSNLTDDLEKQ